MAKKPVENENPEDTPEGENIAITNHNEPDFTKLSASEHNVTEGARMPGQETDIPADTVSGLDAEQKRGPGRRRLTDEERAAAKERKRERDRMRRAGGKAINAPAEKVANAPDQSIEIAKANAAMVIAALDLINNAISGGDYTPPDELKAGTHAAWTSYLHASGYQLPPWVQVGIMTAMYIAPAFATEKGKSKLSGVFAKVKGWWIARRG